MEVKANNPILYKGTGTPYLAIFDNQGIPVMNPLTGIPLGAYISSWSYVYDEEKENLQCDSFLTEKVRHKTEREVKNSLVELIIQ